MKQHITVEQWNELSDKGKIKIAEKFSDGINGAEFYTNPSVLIRLSIGQMIEFLDDKKNIVIMQDMIGGWRVGYTEKDKQFIIDEEELADALFEAVKECLEY